MASSEIQTLSIGPTDRTSVLKHMLLKVHHDMVDRYGSLLENFNVENWLEESLSPAVKQICEQGKFDLIKYIDLGTRLDGPSY